MSYRFAFTALFRRTRRQGRHLHRRRADGLHGYDPLHRAGCPLPGHGREDLRASGIRYFGVCTTPVAAGAGFPGPARIRGSGSLSRSE